MSKLKQLITDDMKLAMKAQDKPALKAIRMILGAIKQKEIDERIELDDNQVMAVIQKMVKQRKDSISQFSDAGRTDLVEVEEAESVTAVPLQIVFALAVIWASFMVTDTAVLELSTPFIVCET